MSFSAQVVDLMEKGGPVMWPLLAMSVIAVGLFIERVLFWTRLDGTEGQRRLEQLFFALRHRKSDTVSALVRARPDPYSILAQKLQECGSDDASALIAIESVRPALERGLAFLSFIVTAAPLLGILGNVFGIIRSFELLGDTTGLRDPREVSSGIAEGLIATATGLVVSLFALLPLILFRSRCDRGLARLEALVAAARALASPPINDPS
ncbi:MAG: MotA/TolQ/ExbB proton channel family protein [Planctomycetota bacterium]|nr:MotA/TolQ/ExbB proton channel family protein [Planctomycetota bacterium]